MMTDADLMVLVADDDPAALDTLVEVAWGNGLRPFSAASGQQAIELTIEHKLSFGVIDFDFPDMTGVEVVRRIRTRIRIFPVIIVSGNSNAQSYGADLSHACFLRKPLDLTRISRELQSVLNWLRLGEHPASDARQGRTGLADKHWAHPRPDNDKN